MSSTITIVGAGIVGSALAHFLSSSSSRRKIILIDHSLSPLQGSTAHAPGYIGQFNESPTLTRLAIDSVTEYAKIPNGFEVLGGIEAVNTSEGISRLQARCDAAVQRGLPASMITPAQAAGLAPELVRQSDIQAALYFATDGVANATDITEFFQQEARRKGVEFVEGVVGGIRYGEDGEVFGAEIEEIVGDEETDDIHDEPVKRKMKRVIETDTLILATGIWTQDLCADLDIPIPIIPVAHPYMYIRHDRLNEDNASSQSISSPRSESIRSPLGSPLSSSSSSSSSPNRTRKSPLSPRLNNKPCPWIRYPEHQVYARDHGPFYGVGTYDHGPAMYCEPNDHVAIGPWQNEVFNSALERAKTLLPILATVDGGKDSPMMGGLTAIPETKFNGLFAMTPDNLPLAGRVDGRKGLFLCAAVWVTHAAGMAKFVAGLVDHDSGGKDGENHSEERWNLDDVVRDLNPGRFRGKDWEDLKEQSLKGYSQIYHTGEN